MNPKERMLKAIRGGAPDRVPLHVPGFECESRDDIAKFQNPLKRKIAERIFDKMHYWVRIPSHINRMLVTPPQRVKTDTEPLPDGCRRTIGTIDTPMGQLHYEQIYDPHAQTTWWKKYPVETKKDIEKIASVPWELPMGLAPPDERIIDRAGERGIISTSISSPFVCVAGMMKYEMFLEMCLTDIDWIKELTQVCLNRTMDCLRVLLARPGIEYVWIGGSEWVTPPMASPEIYDALVQEQEREIISYVHDCSDAVVHIHCHGRVREALPKMVERGGDYTEPVEPPPDGDLTMAEAKQIAAGRITLGGNVECRVLCNGDEQAVEAAARAAFEGGKERFVLRPTEGPSPDMSEREFKNYMRFIDVWEEMA